MHDPEWLQGYFDGQKDALYLYSLQARGRSHGFAPFVKTNWPMKWQVGDFTIARLPLTRLRLLGGTAAFPPDEVAYDLLFTELANARYGCDVVHLEEIPLDSFLWRYLRTRALIRRLFLVYQPEAPSPHPLLRLQGSFEEYMGKFSSKHRKNLRRELKRVRDGSLGPARFVRIQQPEELASFLDHAVAVSRKTYQWTLHQQGLSETDTLRQRLQFAANHGWMRSYLLFCGDAPCAFVVGFQHNGRFLLHEIGFDPALAKYSVGTVLQLLIIEDLFTYNSPDILDFGDYGAYKEMWSTESYAQGRVLLFHRSAYTRFVRAGHFSAELTNRCISSLLDRWHLKSKLKQRVRGWNSSQ